MILRARQQKIGKKLGRMHCKYDKQRRYLHRKALKRRQRERGTDRHFWRMLSQALKRQWRLHHQQLPENLGKAGWRWVGRQLDSRNYSMALRIYLILLFASDPKWREENRSLSGYL